MESRVKCIFTPLLQYGSYSGSIEILLNRFGSAEQDPKTFLKDSSMIIKPIVDIHLKGQ